MENNSEESLEYLILNGYVEVSGIDSETKNFLYSFTEKAKRVIPDLRRQLDEEFYQSITYLWEHGFLEMDIESDNPTVTLKEKALDPNEVALLSEIHRTSLISITEVLRQW
jgi:DNA-binding PadR family transcriptional regulator